MAETKPVEQPKFVLPTKIVKADNHNPRNLIIFSKPKVGKTSLLATLENNLITNTVCKYNDK